QMADMMKKMGKGGMMKQVAKAMMGKGAGMPDLKNMDPAQLEQAARAMKSGMPGLGGGGFPGMGGGLPSGLSGMFKKK
ncbi:MAG: signal recognition particle protein, partial [Gemmobacter sp.]|nr:signal recognition particle protein [Gemmobacter sp.]